MPLLDIRISDSVKIISHELVEELTRTAADISGKPEIVIMTKFSQEEIYMGNKKILGAFIEYRYTGKLDEKIKNTLCNEFNAVIHKYLTLDNKNLYINFISMERNDWGVGEELLK